MNKGSPVPEAIREYIVREFLFGAADETFTDEDSLIDAGIIDSVGVLELVAFLQRRFGVEVMDADLVPEHFDSIAGMARFVGARRSPA